MLEYCASVISNDRDMLCVRYGNGAAAVARFEDDVVVVVDEGEVLLVLVDRQCVVTIAGIERDCRPSAIMGHKRG